MRGQGKTATKSTKRHERTEWMCRGRFVHALFVHSRVYCGYSQRDSQSGRQKERGRKMKKAVDDEQRRGTRNVAQGYGFPFSIHCPRMLVRSAQMATGELLRTHLRRCGVVSTHVRTAVRDGAGDVVLLCTAQGDLATLHGPGDHATVEGRWSVLEPSGSKLTAHRSLQKRPSPSARG